MWTQHFSLLAAEYFLVLLRSYKGPFTHAIFGAIFVALSNATFVASVN